MLDFAGVDPNPARDRRVRLPRSETIEIVPPTAREVLAMLDAIARRWRLLLITIEQTAMAIGETTQLEWGDVDVNGLQFRLRRTTVKGGIRARARWVQVPEWLMAHLVETCPLDDRTAARRVFPGLTPDGAWSAMDRACANAGVARFSPHDLRHRRISLWHGQGIPSKELAARAGHTKASMSLDVYSHVMPLDEVPVDSFEDLLVVTR
jgi:integrase